MMKLDFIYSKTIFTLKKKLLYVYIFLFINSIIYLLIKQTINFNKLLIFFKYRTYKCLNIYI